MYLIETFNKKEDDKLIDIENGGIYECLIESELAIHSIFESMYQMDKNEICGIVTESIGDKLKSLGSKIMKGLESIKNFLKKLIKSFINLFKKADQDDSEFVKKAEAKAKGGAHTSSNNTKEKEPNKDTEKKEDNKVTLQNSQSKNTSKQEEPDDDSYVKTAEKKWGDGKSSGEKEITIKGYNFIGLYESYKVWCDIEIVFDWAMEIIGASPMDFANKHRNNPKEAFKDARKKLIPHLTKRLTHSDSDGDFKQLAHKKLYGSTEKVSITIKYSKAINELKNVCPNMLKTLNASLQRVDSIFADVEKCVRESDSEVNEYIGRDDTFDTYSKLQESHKALLPEFISALNDIKSIYVTSLNMCIKAVNTNRQQLKFAIKQMLNLYE